VGWAWSGALPPPLAFMPSMAVGLESVYIASVQQRGRRRSSNVPWPFSISGIGATLFLACCRVAWMRASVGSQWRRAAGLLTSPALPWTMLPSSKGPFWLDPSPWRGMFGNVWV
jgi:hypothetical protein